MDVRILGPLEVRVGGRVLPLGGTKQRAVLAMLVLDVGRVVAVDRLIDGLWGDDPPDSATNVVQAYVSRLRKVFDAAIADSAADGAADGSADGSADAAHAGAGLLRHRRPGYLLELDAEHCDLQRFQRLTTHAAGQRRRSAAEAAATLRQALDLWHGPPLAEFDAEPFAVTERHRLAEQRLAAILAMVEAELALGHHAQLIPQLEALTGEHPLHEELAGQLMIGLFRSGRAGEALEAFRRIRDNLAEELGIDPGRRLIELEAAVLARDPRLEWRRAPEVVPAREREAATSSVATGSGTEDAASPRAPAEPLPMGPVPTEPLPTEPLPTELLPTRIWNIPARNPHFTGRAEALAAVRDSFEAAGELPAVVALYGLGGVGKTQLAVEYAHRYAADYPVAWWIDAEQPVLIPDQIAGLAARLGLPAQGNASEVLDRLLTRLAELSRFLLIFDNAERPADIAAYRPIGTGHVVVTSRFPGWGALGRRMAVDVLRRKETVALLRARSPEIGDPIAQKLAAELGDLPLAVAQAAAYLEQTGTEPVDYLRQFRTRRASLLARGDVLGYQGRVDTAWEMSLERLRAASPAAVELLELAAFMAPEAIPLQLFSDHADLLSGALRAVADDGPDLLADAVGAAVGYSLVYRQQDTFQLHRLVQAVIRDRLTAEEHDAIGIRAATLLAAANPGEPADPANWTGYARLAAHVLATAPLGDHLPQCRELTLNTVQYLNVRGDTRGARVVAETLLERWRRVLDADHPATLGLATMLTSMLAWLGEADSASALGEDTLQRCRGALGPDDPVTLSCATYLTSALAWLGRNDEARLLGHDTLDRCRTNLGPDHPTSLASAAQWTFTLLGLDQVQAAADLSADTAGRCNRVLGPYHPTTLVAESASTIAQAWIGSAESAAVLGRQTVDRCATAFGADHWLSVTASAAQTFALAGLGEFGAARALSEDTFERSRTAFGPDHWVTLLVAAALTFALVGLGETDLARSTATETLQRTSRTLGPEHPIARNLTDQLALLGP